MRKVRRNQAAGGAKGMAGLSVEEDGIVSKNQWPRSFFGSQERKKSQTRDHKASDRSRKG